MNIKHLLNEYNCNTKLNIVITKNDKIFKKVEYEDFSDFYCYDFDKIYYKDIFYWYISDNNIIIDIIDDR